MSMKNAVDCTRSAGWLTLGSRISLQVYSIITGIFEYQLFSRSVADECSTPIRLRHTATTYRGGRPPHRHHLVGHTWPKAEWQPPDEQGTEATFTVGRCSGASELTETIEASHASRPIADAVSEWQLLDAAL